MNFKTFQQCRDLDGWQAVRIPSATSQRMYTVHVNPWGAIQENICECEGYTYRGYCHHQDEATEKLCDWVENGEETQSPSQRQAMICPRCGRTTMWVIDVDETF